MAQTNTQPDTQDRTECWHEWTGTLCSALEHGLITSGDKGAKLDRPGFGMKHTRLWFGWLGEQLTVQGLDRIKEEEKVPPFTGTPMFWSEGKITTDD